MSKKNIISEIEIDDPSDIPIRGVAVIIRLVDGSTRFCVFFSPESINNCGDILQGTNVRFQYGCKHMIVASELSVDIIHKTLAQLDEDGEILDCTMSLDE